MFKNNFYQLGILTEPEICFSSVQQHFIWNYRVAPGFLNIFRNQLLPGLKDVDMKHFCKNFSKGCTYPKNVMFILKE